MNKKSTSLLLCIFLFVGLFFSLEIYEHQTPYGQEESFQVYSVSVESNITSSTTKLARRNAIVSICIVLFGLSVLYQVEKRKILTYLKRSPIWYYLKQIEVSQSIDGKKRMVF